MIMIWRPSRRGSRTVSTFHWGVSYNTLQNNMFSLAAHQPQRVPAEALEDNGIKFDNVTTSWAEPVTLVLLIIVFDRAVNPIWEIPWRFVQSLMMTCWYCRYAYPATNNPATTPTNLSTILIAYPMNIPAKKPPPTVPTRGRTSSAVIHAALR